MKNHRLELALSLIFALILVLFCYWQAPGSRLSKEEIDADVARFEQLAPLPPAEKAAMAARLRAWAEADDGQPVYNLNLMRFYKELRQMPGAEVKAASVPEANAHYEASVKPLLVKLGVTIPFAGPAQQVLGGASPSGKLVDNEAGVDNLDRVLLVRYPSRRAFLDLVCDPEYLKVMPYKIASVMLVLMPLSSELIMPDLRFVLGALFALIVLVVGWWRAERRNGGHV